MKGIRKLSEIIKDRSFILTVIATFLFGLIAHSYSYFNVFYSHDSLLVYQNDIVWQISLGRFLHPVYFLFRGNFYTPSLVGLLSLVFIALSAYIVIKLLSIKKPLLIVLVCGVMTINATVTLLNATYMLDIDIFMLSLLFALTGVLFIRKYKRGFFIAPLFFCLSLGLYQSYFQVAVFLLMILLVKDILEKKDTKTVLTFGAKSLSSLFAGLILYYIVLRIVLFATGIELGTGYNSISTVGQYDSLFSILYSLGATYYRVLAYFIKPIIYHPVLMGVVNVIIILLCAFFLISIVVVKKIRGWNLAILIAAIFLMPFGMNVTCFFAKGMQHSLMIYSFFFVYIFAVYLSTEYAELKAIGEIDIKKANFKQLSVKFVIPVLLAVILFNGIIYSNQTYLYKDLVYQNTLLTVNRVIDRMEQTDGYVIGETPVVFVGDMNHSKLSLGYQGIDNFATGLDGVFAITYYETYEYYFRNILSYPINILNVSESLHWAENQQVREMPVFPHTDSCKIIDGTLVIKFSNNFVTQDTNN